MTRLPSVRTRSATARTCSTATAPGSTTSDRTVIPNPDYKGDRVAQNGGLTTSSSTRRRMRHTPTCRVETSTCIDASRTAHTRRSRVELGDRAVNQPAAIFQSFTIPQGLAHFTGEEGDAPSSALSMAIDRQQITDVDLRGHPHAGERLHVAGHRRLVRQARRCRRAQVQPRRGEEAVGRGRRHLPVGRHLQDRLQRRRWTPGLGRRCDQRDQEHARHRGSGNPYPTFAVIPHRRNRPHHHDRVPYRMAGRLPGSVQLPRTDLRARVLARTTVTTRALSSTHSSRKALGEPDTDKANEIFQKAQEVLFKDLPAIPLWYSNVTGGLGADVEQREVRLELRAAVLRDHQEVTCTAGARSGTLGRRRMSPPQGMPISSTSQGVPRVDFANTRMAEVKAG